MKMQSILGALVLLAVSAQAASAQDQWDAGFRLNIVGGTGKPTNDVLGYGLFGRYWLNDDWAIGFGIDRSDEFDIERAAQLVGLQQDPTVKDIDNKAESTALKVWVERQYRSDRRWRWYWGAGIGYNDISVTNATGPTADGGQFDVMIDAGSELLVEGLLGLRVGLGESWFLEGTARVEQHFADWKLRDLETGATGVINDYTLRGVHLAVGYSS